MLTFLRKSSSVSSFLLPTSGLRSVIVVSVCTKGFAYLLCWARGRGIGLVCTRRFSFHEFYNFLPFNFLVFISFWKIFFYPRQIPTPTTHDLYPRPTTFSYTPLKIIQLENKDKQVIFGFRPETLTGLSRNGPVVPVVQNRQLFKGIRNFIMWPWKLSIKLSIHELLSDSFF